jgi:hypothetical protein
VDQIGRSGRSVRAGPAFEAFQVSGVWLSAFSHQLSAKNHGPALKVES